MIQVDEATRIAAARAGDQEAFGHLTSPYRRELLVHCYRMLGSLEDAEDTLQETLLRAWRRLDSFEGRASLRAWLYRIATNASLDALDKRPRRGMPQAVGEPGGPGAVFPGPAHENVWLEPLPDTLIDEQPAANPEARYEARESVALAFLAALQNLPGRQRAVLILRDVLGWKAGEVANLLDMTVAAVNSALQRARATMHDQGHRAGARAAFAAAPPNDKQTASLLARYVEAWETGDATMLVSLLRQDAMITMPPLFLWYRGRETILDFLGRHLFAGQARGRFRLLATRANGAPAFAVYQRDEMGVYRPAALQLLTIEDGLIAGIDDFLVSDARLFSRFGLPAAI